MAPSSPSLSVRARLQNAWHARTLSLKAILFAVIGLVNSAVDFGVFLVARAALDRSPAALAGFAALAQDCHCGMPQALLLIVANTMSWAVAVSGSYVLNSSITFAAESGRQLRWRDYATFVVSGIAGLIASTAALVFAAQTLTLSVWLAKGIAVLVSFVVNFSLSHFVVFRVRGKPPDDREASQ